MTWTLVIIMVLGGAAAISTDMKFVDEASCKAASDRVVGVADRAKAKSVTVACIDTTGRE